MNSPCPRAVVLDSSLPIILVQGLKLLLLIQIVNSQVEMIMEGTGPSIGIVECHQC